MFNVVCILFVLYSCYAVFIRSTQKSIWSTVFYFVIVGARFVCLLAFIHLSCYLFHIVFHSLARFTILLCVQHSVSLSQCKRVSNKIDSIVLKPIELQKHHSECVRNEMKWNHNIVSIHFDRWAIEREKRESAEQWCWWRGKNHP